jgi:hypothetical protein
VVTDRSLQLTVTAQGPLQSVFEGDVARLDERYLGRIYAQTTGRAHFEFQPGGGAKLWFTSYGGDAVDYANGRPAVRFAWGPGGEINLGRHLRVFADHTYDHLRVLGNRRLYTTNILDTRTIYQFNVRAQMRAIVQYVTINRAPELYGFPVPRTRRELLTQILASYKVNPQTVVYLGYSDDHVGPAAAKMIGRERTVFFKIGYAWLV